MTRKIKKIHHGKFGKENKREGKRIKPVFLNDSFPSVICVADWQVLTPS